MQLIVETDLVIVGGGPAGAAAAITARSYALRVVLLERDAAARMRPGEAAHPGIEPLLKRLGVMDAVQTADFLRYEGHWVAWGREPLRFVPFGQDERGPWKGFQLWRPDFDEILLDGADRAGALIVRPCGELHPIVRGNRVAGVETKAGTWRCAFVIDATGRQRWLARTFNLQTERRGPPRVAWFGYAEGHRPALDPNPMIASDASGWTWMARIRPSLYQWVRPAAARSAAPYRLAAGRIRRFAADAPATRHRRQLDYCKSYSRAGIFSYRRCGVDRRPVVVTWHLEGCDVGHEGGASFGGCLAVCR
jgi:2-polyprenyl-6-methoxyphenol hydroxylase-like FAD-dependent oxidoreductase